jgi:hypothetical protein
MPSGDEAGDGSQPILASIRHDAADACEARPIFENEEEIMKAYAFDPKKGGCPCDCPREVNVAFMDSDGDPSDKCKFSKAVHIFGWAPGPDCPLPDVPEPSRFTRIVLDPHVETYDDACVDFVERLRKS